ncbi:hypothetical protein CFR71_10860 [Novacetimonas pomaceti]|uniref:Uncharacterized protein n=1 Tax=Novacetimonas pomaceti TaxID=2021998 RepID=A0A318QIB7_9PROT|nr:hypothetical protein CFR71_10860 [Novacetimonas pomaceti]
MCFFGISPAGWPDSQGTIVPSWGWTARGCPPGILHEWRAYGNFSICASLRSGPGRKEAYFTI